MYFFLFFLFFSFFFVVFWASRTSSFFYEHFRPQATEQSCDTNQNERKGKLNTFFGGVTERW
jgi:hypothetical protein